MVRSYDLSSLLGAFVIFVLFSSAVADNDTVIDPKMKEDCAEMSWTFVAKTNCFNKEFGKSLIKYMGATLEVNEYGHLEEVKASQVPEFTFCCGLYKLQTCFHREVKVNCKESVEEALIDRTALDLLKNFTGSIYDCDFSSWYYKEGSPVCWSTNAQFIAGMGLVYFVLFLCLGICAYICNHCQTQKFLKL